LRNRGGKKRKRKLNPSYEFGRRGGGRLFIPWRKSWEEKKEKRAAFAVSIYLKITEEKGDEGKKGRNYTPLTSLGKKGGKEGDVRRSHTRDSIQEKGREGKKIAGRSKDVSTR